MQIKKSRIKNYLWYGIATYLIIVFFVTVYNNVKWTNDGTLYDKYTGIEESEIEYKKFLSAVMNEENRIYDSIENKTKQLNYQNRADIEELLKLYEELINFLENKLDNIENKYLEVLGKEYTYDKYTREMNEKNIEYYKTIKKFYSYLLQHFDEIKYVNGEFISVDENITLELSKLQNEIIQKGNELNSMIQTRTLE